MNIISISTINKQFEDGFIKKYSGASKFIETSYWEKCKQVLNDAELLNKIIWANDKLKVQPAKSVALDRDPAFTNMDDQDKRSYGAVWGFLFGEVFGYTGKKSISAGNACGIKKATLFTNPNTQITVVNSEVSE